MDWTVFGVAAAGFVATIVAAVVAPWAARRTRREEVYIDALTVMRAAVGQTGLLSAFPNMHMPDEHSFREVARVDALIGIRASRKVRKEFRRIAVTLGEFYAELFRVQSSPAHAPAGAPVGQAALSDIAARFRTEVEQLEGVMRGERRKLDRASGPTPSPP